MDPGDSLQSLQGLKLLVYTAAETGAQQFIGLIFSSSAARVVFNAYRNTSPLPEDVARAYGHEDTAQYLESITKRYIVWFQEISICILRRINRNSEGKGFFKNQAFKGNYEAKLEFPEG